MYMITIRNQVQLQKKGIFNTLHQLLTRKESTFVFVFKYQNATYIVSQSQPAT
jgi:hypothetical protein